SATLDHIDFTEPFCGRLRAGLLAAAAAARVACHDGGVYAVTQGPRLETAAEVNRLERDGADFIGLTAMPAAALARGLGRGSAGLSVVLTRAAGRGERGVQAALEAATDTARGRAVRVLGALAGAGLAAALVDGG